MKNSSHKIKHEQRKAIRAAQKQEDEIEAKKLKKQDIHQFVTPSQKKKTVHIKASSKKKSHKTAPNEMNCQMEPDSIHHEGRRWLKTIQKQILETKARIQKKILKWKKK